MPIICRDIPVISNNVPISYRDAKKWLLQALGGNFGEAATRQNAAFQFPHIGLADGFLSKAATMEDYTIEAD
jgi:hypothetical protein